MIQRHEFSIMADCLQFHVNDETVEGCPTWFGANDGERLLSVEPGFLAVGTIRDTIVPVTVEVREGEPEEDLDGWDQVNKCTLHVSSGRIVLGEIGDPFPTRINLRPGSYRVRVHYGDLDSLGADGRGSDHYKLVLWNATPGPVRVLKQSKKRWLTTWDLKKLS